MIKSYFGARFSHAPLVPSSYQMYGQTVVYQARTSSYQSSTLFTHTRNMPSGTAGTLVRTKKSVGTGFAHPYFATTNTIEPKTLRTVYTYNLFNEEVGAHTHNGVFRARRTPDGRRRTRLSVAIRRRNSSRVRSHRSTHTTRVNIAKRSKGLLLKRKHKRTESQRVR